MRKEAKQERLINIINKYSHKQEHKCPLDKPKRKIERRERERERETETIINQIEIDTHLFSEVKRAN